MSTQLPRNLLESNNRIQTPDLTDVENRDAYFRKHEPDQLPYDLKQQIVDDAATLGVELDIAFTLYVEITGGNQDQEIPSFTVGGKTLSYPPVVTDPNTDPPTTRPAKWTDMHGYKVRGGKHYTTLATVSKGLEASYIRRLQALNYIRKVKPQDIPAESPPS